MTDLRMRATDDPYRMILDGARTARLQPRGEFDRDNRHLLSAVIQRALADGWATVVLDCRHLTFIDVSVVNLLLRERRRVTERGGHLRLTNVHGCPAEVLTATGTAALLCG